MSRCLFINWNDGTAPSQFSVPDDYTLAGRDLLGRRRPRRLEIFDTDARTELYLDLRKIKSAFIVTVAPDQRISER